MSGEVPLISITQDENDDFNDDESSTKPNINECHTDVEDLDSDTGKNNFLISNSRRNSKYNGSVTDVEDYDDSDDDNVVEQEPDYGPEISLSEFLDQGFTDESAKIVGDEMSKTTAMHSASKTPRPSAFNLNVAYEQGGVTDFEDLEASDDEENDSGEVYSDDDKALVLEGTNSVDIHDSVSNRKKPEKHQPKIIETQKSSSSDSDEEKCKVRQKPHKLFVKRHQKCEEAKSDVENIYFSDDNKSKSKNKKIPILETPDIEVIAFEGSDIEEIDNQDMKFPEINISFAENDKKRSKPKYKKTPAPSPMLNLPSNTEEGVTDVENLESSDDDDDVQCSKKGNTSKNLIPIALIKCDALTDVEDFDDPDDEESDSDEKSEPNIVLPSPVRELVVLLENKSGEPTSQTIPLPDNVFLGFDDLDIDKGLTDVEDYTDNSDGDDDEIIETPQIEIDCIADFGCGYVESSDHSSIKGPSTCFSVTPEPKTDTEKVFMKKSEKSSDYRRRKPKSKTNKQKSSFLDTKLYVDEQTGGAHTDVEDLNLEDDDVLLKDKSLKQKRGKIECSARRMSNNNDGKTDIEYVSGDDTLDLFRLTPDINPYLNEYQMNSFSVTMTRDRLNSKDVDEKEFQLPTFRKISIASETQVTDVEEMQTNSDIDDSFTHDPCAIAHTSLELDRNLDDLCSSQIHEILSGTFDPLKERSELKPCQDSLETFTDIENFDDDGPQNI